MRKKLSISLLIYISIIFYSNAQTGIWEELKPTNSPSPRWSFGMAEIGDGKVIIFGGDGGTKFFDDTWIFDYQTNSWSEIKNDIHPPSRSDHRMARITRNKILLFGGLDTVYFNDTWIFDLDSLSWTEVHPNNYPSPRISFGLAQLSDKKVLLIGGDIGVGDLRNDTWIFDILENNWTLLPINNKPPKAVSAMITQIDTGKILFYGGWQFKFLDDTWLFDKNEQKWSKIIPPQNSVHIANSSMSYIFKNEVVFFGGDCEEQGSSGNYDEMWIFNLNDSTWRNIQTNLKPDGRFEHGIVNFGDNKILLFGGLNNTTGTPHNDTWLFTLQPNDYKEDNYTSNENIKSYIISDNENKLKIKIPTTGKLEYQFYDIFGKKLLEKENLFIYDNEIINVDASGITNGLYFFVANQNNNIEVSKVLINR